MTGREVWAFPLAHPSFVLRGKWGFEPAQIAYLKRAREALSGSFTPISLDEPPMPTTTRPTLLDLVRWRQGVTGAGVVLDIETAGPHLVCVGLLCLTRMEAVVVPFRQQGGATYWGVDELPRVVVWLDRLLGDASIPKITHNGAGFDIPYLMELGFECRGFADDTMVMLHTVYPELPKALEFAGVLFGGMPPWKHLSGSDESEEGK